MMRTFDFDERISFQGINHITFAVENLERSMRFYEIIFGVEPIAKGEMYYSEMRKEIKIK